MLRRRHFGRKLRLTLKFRRVLWASSVTLVITSIVALIISSRSDQDFSEQDALDYLGKFLTVKFDVISNSDPRFRNMYRITLTNSGTRNITAHNWSIYFTALFPIKGITLVSPLQNVSRENSKTHKYRHPIQRFTFKLIKSYMYSLTPRNEVFGVLLPGYTLEIMLIGDGSNLARCLNMPNWYVSAAGCKPRILEATKDQRLLFVEGYRRDRDVSNGYDPAAPWTPEKRYKPTSEMRKNASSSRYGVLPSPKFMRLDYKRIVSVNRWTWTIVVSEQDTELLSAAEFLRAKTGVFWIRRYEESICTYCINFIRGTPSLRNATSDILRESYDIVIDDFTPRITIKAVAASGAFYAVQTLLSLLADDFVVPAGVIFDAPRFSYRGIHLDVARNFRTVPEVLKLLEAMSMYKLNRLHLHLSDDEGWRLEIPDIPELTQLGSRRCHDPSETQCLLPLLGSGPFPTTPGSGFFTTDDYRQILRYARERHIEIVPEMDLPGHARAAIKSMLLRYQHKMADGDEKGALKYMLTEENDKSKFETAQGFNDSIINPCQGSTYKFIDKILKTLRELHADISPLKVFHFGGDEVPASAWKLTQACLEMPKSEEEYNTITLKKHFAKEMERLAKEYEGLSLGAWEDALSRSRPGGTVQPFAREGVFRHRDIYVYPWHNRWEDSAPGNAYTFANAGYKVVMSHATSLYLDHPQEPDPEERGLYWATRYIDLFKVFSFKPLRLYDLIDVDSRGHPISLDDACEPDRRKCPPLRRPENIVGMEVHLWGELIRTAEHMHSQLFPRTLALAERAWHEAEWEKKNKSARGMSEVKTADWARFSNLVGRKELTRLDKLGVAYRIPLPGAWLYTTLKTSTEPPGLTVEYSLDGGCTWEHKQNPTLPRNAKLLLRTRSADGSRTSRVVSLNVLGSVRKCSTPPPPRLRLSIVVACFIFIAAFSLLPRTRNRTLAYLIRSLYRLAKGDKSEINIVPAPSSSVANLITNAHVTKSAQS